MIEQEIQKEIQEGPLKRIRISTEMVKEKAREELEEEGEEEVLFKEDVDVQKDLMKKREEVRTTSIRKTIRIKMTIVAIDLKRVETRRTRKKIKILLRNLMTEITSIKKGFLIEGINLKNIIKKKGKKITMIRIDIPKIVLMKKEIINLKTIIKKKVII